MSDVRYSDAHRVASEWQRSPAAGMAAGPSSGAMRSRRRTMQFSRMGFSLCAMTLDFAVIALAMACADMGYGTAVHHWSAVSMSNFQLGLFTAVLFVATNTTRNCYSVSQYLDLSGHAQRVFSQWNIAFLSAATLGFLTRILEDSSRGAFVIFYVLGLFGLYAGHAALVRVVKRHTREGGLLATRIFVIGCREDIDAFMMQSQPARQGLNVVAAPVLNCSGRSIDAELTKATELARQLMPDDIFIVVPWQKTAVLDKCITAFMRVPASLHLYVYPNSALKRFAAAPIGSNGTISSFRLRGDAMSMAGVILKRGCDIVLSLLALTLLAPLFALVALAIKLESAGPVFFVQTRSGFNKMPFRIFKFRSMTVTEDGDSVRQATANDSRVTRVGRILRRFNIDELPQLLNVLIGDMSLVGPRPHALVHDEAFETGIALYARRHNVKPGITGWAQVNGLRGEINTPEKIAQRIQYDLYYIDNWSFVFDIWIMFLTLFSRRAYLNAA